MPVKQPKDDRSPLAVGLEWSSRITTVALEMVVPALLGYWIDQKLGTRLVFLVLGAALGFGMGLRGLLYMVQPGKRDRNQNDG